MDKSMTEKARAKKMHLPTISLKDKHTFTECTSIDYLSIVWRYHVQSS